MRANPRGRYAVYCILIVLAVQSVKHSTQAKGVVISGFSWRRLIVVGALRSTLHLDAFGAYALSSAQGAVPRLAAHLEGAGDAGHAPPGTMEPDDCQTCLSGVSNLSIGQIASLPPRGCWRRSQHGLKGARTRALP